MAHSWPFEKIQIRVEPELQAFLPKYVQNRAADLERLNGFLKDGDLDGIQSVSHKIRGHATSYGMAPLGEICRKMEVAARNGEVCEIASLLGKFQDYLERIELP